MRLRARSTTSSLPPGRSQPGEFWLYNTWSDLQGVLISRVTGRPLPEVFAERFFEPLGMVDTGFAVPAADLVRLSSSYRAIDDGLELADAPDGQWARMPEFPSGAGASHPPSTTTSLSPGCWSVGERSTGSGCCHPTPSA